jgi:hypothetical protein
MAFSKHQVMLRRTRGLFAQALIAGSVRILRGALKSKPKGIAEIAAF